MSAMRAWRKQMCGNRQENSLWQAGRDGRAKRWHPAAVVPAGKKIRRLLRQGVRRAWPALLLSIVISPDAFSQASPSTDEIAGDIMPGQMQSGSLLLRMKNGYQVATRVNTDINAQVSGMVARVNVRQSFRNSGSEWVEGVYVFPLPDTAVVDRLRMTIGERIIEGEIRQKSEAKKEYEAAKTAGKKASLVEQQRANLFTTSVANVAPGETVAIEIEYLQTLRYDDENFSLRFPITITPRYIPGAPLPGRKGSGWSADTDRVVDASLITPPAIASSNSHRISFHAEIDAGVALEIIASRYHPISVTEQKGHYEIDLAGSDVPMDHDLELTWKPVAAAAPRAMMFTESIDGQPHLLLMLLPPAEEHAAATDIPRELIFVVDTSGSMHGTSIDQAIRALSLALGGLKPVDRFNVIQFNSTTAALFPGAVDATVNNLGIAKRFVAGLTANGGTEMRPAIEQVLLAPVSETHLRQVIFITDGSVGNEQELFNLIEKNLGATRLFTVGIGAAPNSWFMRKAAQAGRGSFTFISALHEVNEKMARLFRKLEQPQITDVVVQWPNGQNPLSYPQKVPDLYSGEPILVTARMDQEVLPGDVVSISGKSGGGSWGAELSVDMQQESSGVAALWARARIEDLLDQESRGADAGKTREAVIETALTHHLVSKYTSLVAVDKTPARPAASALSGEQVPNLLPYGQSHNAIFGFPATATAAGSYRLSGLLLIVFALFLLLVLTPGSRHREFAQIA
jgi:Ca-activated chloride channel family protein